MGYASRQKKERKEGGQSKSLTIALRDIQNFSITKDGREIAVITKTTVGTDAEIAILHDDIGDIIGTLQMAAQQAFSLKAGTGVLQTPDFRTIQTHKVEAFDTGWAINEDSLTLTVYTNGVPYHMRLPRRTAEALRDQIQSDLERSQRKM